jgi:hypothetical protein
VDPASAWKPWEPTDKDPWGLKWAGHLYRRAGFGATAAELRDAVAKGHEATLRRLLEGDADAEQRYRFLTVMGDQVLRKGGGNEAYELRAWWLYAMMHSPQPLREKMTLFWHNHFATSIAKVQKASLMYGQNKLLRGHALGKFRPFLLEMSRDPAMIVWLDNNNNVKGKPNENYAREIMELFSLGVGNYSEKDVREAARAFTGWHTTVGGDAYEFIARLHDDDPKTVLGQTGNWNGDDVVRILLDQPQAARFLVRKLYRFLVSETQEAPDALLEPLAESFRKSDYDIGALVGTMLRSRHFFSGYAFRQRLKSPVELVLGAARAVAHPTEEQDSVRLPPGPMLSWLETMGQALFAPPNVKGWPGGRSWLNTSTVLARNNFCQRVAFGRVTEENYEQPFYNPGVPPPDPNVTPPQSEREGPEPEAAYDPADLVRQAKAADPAKAVDLLVDLFLPGGISAAAHKKVVAFVAEGKPQGKAFNRRVREAAHTLMAMPEYQLA